MGIGPFVALNKLATFGTLPGMETTIALSRQTLATSETAGLTMEGFYNQLDALYARLEEMHRQGTRYSREDYLKVIHQIRDLRLQNPYQS